MSDIISDIISDNLNIMIYNIHIKYKIPLIKLNKILNRLTYPKYNIKTVLRANEPIYRDNSNNKYIVYSSIESNLYYAYKLLNYE